ncbi:MAG: SCP-2 sterol transfer family protein [Gammaproteobacteria bacterium]|nr:SCP-2 sterol transfer family protein [Gammaproteobacteria bacterium]MBL7000879.1 SCP-2 sterol transfer family protein [Gammaproteobacteria bacterium]
MTELFSDEWMKKFQQEWNNEPELSGALEKINFSSVIGYGFKGADKASGFIKVENGKVTEAGGYNGEALNWDMRADSDNWQKWFQKELGMTGLGMAVTTGKLKFSEGDFKAMVKDPRMATPFIKSFSVMGKV